MVRMIEPFPGLVPPRLGLAYGAHRTYSVGAIYPPEIHKAVRFRLSTRALHSGWVPAELSKENPSGGSTLQRKNRGAFAKAQ